MDLEAIQPDKENERTEREERWRVKRRRERYKYIYIDGFFFVVFFCDIDLSVNYIIVPIYIPWNKLVGWF